MLKEQRKDERFVDIGRVDAPDLCVFPGVLEDISLLGGKIRFPVILDVNMEMDVDLIFSPSQKESNSPIHLIGKPMWVQKEESETQIGFKFLRSPGTNLLTSYIEKLVLENSEYQDDNMLLCSVM